MTELAQDVVRRAVARGVDDAECVVREGTQFSVTIRLGEVENLTDSGSKAIGLRVLHDHRSASSYSSDFSGEGLEKLIAGAVEAVKFTSSDPCQDLPEEELLGPGADPESLLLYSDDLLSLSAAQRIDLAKECEQAALDYDPRVTNSSGASFSLGWGNGFIANSRGFSGGYRGGRCALSVSPMAEQNGDKQRDYWYTIARRPADLEDAVAVGRQAARRAVERLQPRKVPTKKVPVVFEPQIAKSLVTSIFSAASGTAIYRESSFLSGQLGKPIAAPEVNIVDDWLRPGGFGSAPFDDEGVRARDTPVVRAGVLENYLLNCYTARRLGMKTTGNASRGLAGNPGIGAGNLILQPGPLSPEEIIGTIKEGLFVTELIGFGVNLVTGDYSRGASGFWIENGRLTYPVSEVTIAGNLKQMLRDIDAIGNDLDARGSVVAPTLRIREMTVAGK